MTQKFSARAAPLEAGAVVTLRETTVLELLARLAGHVSLIAPPITSGRLPTLAELFPLLALIADARRAILCSRQARG